MNQKIRDFVDNYNTKPRKTYTVSDYGTARISFEQLIKDHNHEIWRKCSCGNEEDLRMTFTCTSCGAVLYESKKKIK